jgi:hypothetical protein
MIEGCSYKKCSLNIVKAGFRLTIKNILTNNTNYKDIFYFW